MALKCYTRPVERLGERYSFLEGLEHPCITQCRWLPEELFVYTDDHSGEWMPVTVTPWIEGHTLLREVRRLCLTGRSSEREQAGSGSERNGSESRSEGSARKESSEFGAAHEALAALAALAGKFDRMALWLLGQDFAHGDLKHDNIMVDGGGELRLIDFDGAYIPSLTGERSPSLGSPAYQHPRRDESFFNRHLDDYSIALISLSLHALAEDSALFERYNDSENLILNASEVAAGKSEPFRLLQKRWVTEGSVWLLALSDMLLSRTPELPGLEAVLGALGGEPVPLTDDYEIVDDSDFDCALVRHGGLYGYASLGTSAGIGRPGERGVITGQHLIIPAVYSDAQPFSDGLAAVELRGRKMFIDQTGRNVIDCAGYDFISSFRDAKACVCDREGKWLVIGQDGQKLTDKEFNSLKEARAGTS